MNLDNIAEIRTMAIGAARQAVPLAVRWMKVNWTRVVVALHIAKVIFWFREINPFSGFPITNVDYIQFYGRALRIHEFLARSNRIWGYDPFDMAGYISGPFHEVGTHAIAVLAHFLEPILPISVTMFTVEVAVLAALPFLAFPIMRCFGADRRTRWIGYTIVVLTFGVMEPFSVLMHKVGLWGFMTAGFLSLLQVGLMYRWFEHGSRKAWLRMTVVTAVLFQVHPAALIIVAVPSAFLLATYARRMGFRGWAALVAMAAIVGVSNWYWISPFLGFSHWRTTAPYYVPRGLFDIAERFGPVQPDLFSSCQALLNCGAVVLSWIAIGRIRERRPALARMFTAWIVWLFIAAYFGDAIPWVRTLQPGRNEFPMFLILYLLSATVVVSDLLSWRRARVIAWILAGLAILFMFEKGPGDAPWSQYASPLRTDLMPWQDQLIHRLRTDKTPEGRVMLECADTLHPHFADVIPEMTGVVLLGGQHPGNFLATRFSLFSGDRMMDDGTRSTYPLAFDRDLSLMDEKEFAQYLDIYNVSTIIARTAQMNRALARMNGVIKFSEQVGYHRVYDVVRATSSWFAYGDGRLTMDYDVLTIDNASKGVLIPKVHWFDTFKTRPPVPIKPIHIGDDPVPFLQIDNSAGHERIVVYNGGLPPIRERIRGIFRHKEPW